MSYAGQAILTASHPVAIGGALAILAATKAAIATGGVSMADNILLLHFDAASWSDGAMVQDSSGTGRHGVLRFNGQTGTSVEGAFGRALDLDPALGPTHIHLIESAFSLGDSALARQRVLSRG